MNTTLCRYSDRKLASDHLDIIKKPELISRSMVKSALAAQLREDVEQERTKYHEMKMKEIKITRERLQVDRGSLKQIEDVLLIIAEGCLSRHG